MCIAWVLTLDSTSASTLHRRLMYGPGPVRCLWTERQQTRANNNNSNEKKAIKQIIIQCKRSTDRYRYSVQTKETVTPRHSGSRCAMWFRFFGFAQIGIGKRYLTFASDRSELPTIWSCQDIIVELTGILIIFLSLYPSLNVI